MKIMLLGIEVSEEHLRNIAKAFYGEYVKCVSNLGEEYSHWVLNVEGISQVHDLQVLANSRIESWREGDTWQVCDSGEYIPYAILTWKEYND